MSSHPRDIPGVTPVAILEQLDRVLSSAAFKDSERSSKLLGFLIEQTLGGHADRLKEYTLGTGALGKASSFDPRLDPSVRSEVSRLRTRLDRYYAIEGAADPIAIVLPKGSYVPQFENRGVAAGAKSDIEDSSPPMSRWHAVRLLRLKSATGIAVLGAALAVAVGVFSFRDFAPSSAPPGIVAEHAAAASPATGAAIAVLPFLNLSGDPNQEYFSDGITEEITAALARIPDLRIVARTSAFQFKQQNRDIRTIGKQLNATHLIEGSVRKDGDRVRITAQLVDASNGVRIANESYDRNVSDLFTTQEDIARTVVTALMAPLVLAPGENLINNRNIDPDSYQAYLRAKALIRGRGFKPMTDGAALLEQVVTRNPDYAPAWALLSEAYALSPLFHPAWTSDSQPELKRMIDAGIRRAEAAAERAVKLDSKNPDAYVSLANIRRARGELVEAEELYRKALQIDGDNSDVIHQYSELLAEVGRGTEAARMRQRLRVLDPFVPIYNYVTSMFLNANGNREDALGLANDLPATFPYRPFIQAQIYASQGRFGEAADLVARLPPEFIYPAVPQKAAKLLRIAPHRAPSVETLPRLGMLSFVYLYAGAPERSLELAEDDAEFGYSMGGYIGTLWDSAYADVRKTERFKIYAQHAGLVDYWRARGWPPQCHPTTGDDFECN